MGTNRQAPFSESEQGRGGPPRTPPNWRALLYAVPVLGLLLVGSLIGSAHERSVAGARPRPTAPVTGVAAPVVPRVTVTATVTATIDAQPTELFTAEAEPIALIAHGTGPAHTATFTTTHVFFDVVYSYDCLLRGSPGRFVATLYRNGDDVGPVAREVGPSGNGVAYLGNGRGTFYVVLDTACSWTVVVVEEADR